MRDRRLRIAVVVACAWWTLLALATPAVAAADSTDLHPVQSENADLIESLNLQFLYVALPLTLFVMVILVYAVVRFRNNDDPRPTAEDAPLEITWTAATAVILLFVGVSAYSVLASPYVSPGQQVDSSVNDEGNYGEAIPEDAVVVEVVAHQWEWQFRYEEANVTTRNELVLPADEDVYLVMTSRDVIHSLAIPDLGVKQDVFPEERTVIRTNVHERGTYETMCTEFCGAQHSTMRANATVVDRDAYDEWLENHGDETGVTEAPSPSEADGDE